MRKLLFMSALAIIVLAGCITNEQVDTKAPDFALQDMMGKSVKLSDYRGKVVLLEFWATWCGPCRALMPSIEKLYMSYKDKGLVVLAVSMDEGDWSTVNSFVKYYGITYPVLKGTDDVASKYRVRAIPLLLILDKEGNIYKRYPGFVYEDDLGKAIKAIL